MYKLIVAFTLLLTSQGYAQIPSIIGRWETDVEKIVASMDGASKARYDSLPETAKSRARTSMAEREFEFMADSTVTVKWKVNASERTSTGTWELSDGNQLLLLRINGDEKTYAITWSHADEIILTANVESGLFTKIVLVKKPE